MGTEMEMNSNTNTVHFMDHGIIVDSSLSRFIKEGIFNVIDSKILRGLLGEKP